MEKEYKWSAERADFDAICAAFPHSTVTEGRMVATYYDTDSRILQEQKIGLRMRMENEISVCCMKVRGESQDGLHVHHEYECPAPDLHAGLRKLASIGAPADLCNSLVDAPLFPICSTEFVRTAVLLTGIHFTAELTFDLGQLSAGHNTQPFHEIEMELKSGNFDEFAAFGLAIAQEFSLKPQPLSKMARALALAR